MRATHSVTPKRTRYAGRGGTEGQNNLEEKMKEYIKGGKSEGMDCESIAEKHGVSVESIEKQEKMGIKIEHEHTPDDNIAAEIARDHLAEFPTYYSFLEDMEAAAKKDYKAKGYGKKKEKEDDTDAAKQARLKKLFG